MNKYSRFASQTLKLAAVALAVAGAGSAMAAPTTATATSTSTVITPINITQKADLAFGKFIANTGGTVTVSTSGARTNTGVTLMTSTTTAAKFDVTGEKSTTYAITVPASVTLTGGGGSDTMSFVPVNDLTGANTTTGTVTAGTLDSSGKQSIYVGGVLTVAANQASGDYTGGFNVGVEYN
jgi:hypothetical protein